MKVLQVIDYMPETSGGSRFVSNICLGLQREGIEVDLLLIDGAESSFVKHLKVRGINVYNLGFDINRYNPLNAYKMANYFKGYDIIHAHVFPTSYIVALTRILYKIPGKFIFTEHNSFNRRATNLFFCKLESLMYKQFDRIVAINNKLIKFLSKTNVTFDEKKIITIINGINLEEIQSTLPSNRSEFQLKEEDVVVVMAARFAPQKDHKTLIAAMSNLPSNYKLLLCGDGVTLHETKEFSKFRGLGDRVQFLGSRSDVLNIIKMSDINVLSSFYEGFGLSIAEAMAASKPVIGTNVDGLDDVLEDGGLIFEVGDVDALSEHIKNLGSNRDYYMKMSNKAFQKSKKYSLSSMVLQYVSLYKEVLKVKR